MSKSVTMCPLVLTQYWRWREGQTDRRMDRIGKTVSLSACVGMLTNNKTTVNGVLNGDACIW